MHTNTPANRRPASFELQLTANLRDEFNCFPSGIIASSQKFPLPCSAQNAQKYVLFAAIKTMCTFYLLSIVNFMISFFPLSDPAHCSETLVPCL
jgi:hypothetical protein